MSADARDVAAAVIGEQPVQRLEAEGVRVVFREELVARLILDLERCSACSVRLEADVVVLEDVDGALRCVNCARAVLLEEASAVYRLTAAGRAALEEMACVADTDPAPRGDT